ncbi:MAG: metallophosphoesterase family protein [Deltaproteobacteria bacterium]|nr:metallophosphoesterase family protein [Deltaproteobacteria bacterium]MBW2072204.1 metallophosphoesterase family protein [Deltaproteobacteria bacterium]
MKVAIISDIHSNLEAFRAVLEDINKEGEVTTVVQLGDVVGYNASPSECVEVVRNRRIISIQGNHDRAVAQSKYAESFNILAHQALRWSAKELDSGQRRFLRNLPHTRVLWGRYLLFHGAPENPDAYIYYLHQAKRAFNYMRKKTPGTRLAFFGHTHRRAVWQRDIRGKVATVSFDHENLVLDPECMYLVNPGSVGQPRGREWRASYLLFSTEPETIRFKSVAYDVQQAQKKIREADLPEYLAERLANGI